MYRQFNIQQFHVLPHTAVFMCFVWISEQTAIIYLYNINRLVCITHNVFTARYGLSVYTTHDIILLPCTAAASQHNYVKTHELTKHFEHPP